MPPIRFIPVLLSVLLTLSVQIFAAAPALDALFPAGGQAGTEVEVTMVGKADPWPPQIWCSSDKVKIEPAKDKNKFKITIAADAKAEPCLVRLFNAEGASAAKIFVVSDQPEILEKDPNDKPAEPQIIEELPVILNGKFEKSDDVDFFRLPPLKKGQQLAAKIHCYSLGTAADPFLHLLNPSGYEIDLASISHNLDPILNHEIPSDGAYLIQTNAIAHKASTSVSFTGGSDKIYRLELSTIENLYPPLPEATAQEKGESQRLSIPTRLEGTLAKDKEVDRYVFPATKGQKVFVRVESQRLGRPADPVLRIIRPDETEYRTIDDVKPYADPELLVSAPLDGDYVTEIKDRFRRGGEDFVYHLVLEEPQPDFSVTTDKDAYALKPGESADVKLKVTRENGHKTPLKMEISGLPSGVSFESPEIPEKGGDVTVKLQAAADTAPANQPIRIRVVETESENPQSHLAEFSFQTGDSRGDYLINEHSAIWLTILARPEPKDEKPTEKSDS